MDKLRKLDMCRLCFATSGVLLDLDRNLTDLINACFSLKIFISPELPSKICQNCVDKLTGINKYRKTIIQNQLMLSDVSKNEISDKFANNSKVENDTFMPSDDSDSNMTGDSTLFEEVNAEIDKRNANIINSERGKNNTDVNENEYSENIKKTGPIYEVSNMCVPGNDNGEKKSQNSNKINVITRLDIYLNNGNKTQDTTVDVNSRNETTTDKIKTIHKSNENVNNLQTISNTEIMEDINVLFDPNKTDNPNIESLEIDENHLPNIYKNVTDPNISNNVEDMDLNKNDYEHNIDKNETVTNTPKHSNSNPNIDVTMEQQNPDENIEFIIEQTKGEAINAGRRFSCLTCLQEFGSQKELSHHYGTVELSKAATEISKKSRDPNIFKAIKDDEGKTKYKCGICGKLCAHKSAVIKHSQIHKVDRPYLCNLCGGTYKTVADIVRHGVVHFGYKFVCLYKCGYSTVHLGAMREHVKLHRKVFKYKCDRCEKRFQVKTWYDQHQNVHDKVRPFACKLCGQSFSMARYLSAHITNVHPQTAIVKRYKCTDCTQPCDSKKSLMMHMQQKHDVKTECLCDVCGKIVQNSQKLILHKNIHQVSKMFSCRFCKKTFNKKDHKTVHERIHTGERLNCGVCSKSFTQRCSLRRHVKRYHQGDLHLLENRHSKDKTDFKLEIVKT